MPCSTHQGGDTAREDVTVRAERESIEPGRPLLIEVPFDTDFVDAHRCFFPQPLDFRWLVVSA